MSKRRRYSPEFKREAIALSRQPGANCRQVALEIGINPNLLSRWAREAEEVPSMAFKGSERFSQETRDWQNGLNFTRLFYSQSESLNRWNAPDFFMPSPV
jgi:transposase-like protein